MQITFYDKLQEDLKNRFNEITFPDTLKDEGILKIKLFNTWRLDIDLKAYFNNGEFYEYEFILLCVSKTIEKFWLEILGK